MIIIILMYFVFVIAIQLFGERELCNSEFLACCKQLIERINGLNSDIILNLYTMYTSISTVKC